MNWLLRVLKNWWDPDREDRERRRRRLEELFVKGNEEMRKRDELHLKWMQRWDKARKRGE